MSGLFIEGLQTVVASSVFPGPVLSLQPVYMGRGVVFYHTGRLIP